LRQGRPSFRLQCSPRETDNSAMPGKRTGFGDSHRENTAESADHPPEKLSERRDHSQSRIGKVRIELCVHLVTSFSHYGSGEAHVTQPLCVLLISNVLLILARVG
jgi:hypothetical protein